MKAISSSKVAAAVSLVAAAAVITFWPRPSETEMPGVAAPIQAADLPQNQIRNAAQPEQRALA